MIKITFNMKHDFLCIYIDGQMKFGIQTRFENIQKNLIEEGFTGNYKIDLI